MKRFAYIAVILAVVPLLAFGPAERVASTHWAFIIGISDYIHFDDVEGGDLPGAEHDAQVIRDLLLDKYGFPEANVRMVLNHDATRAAIEEGITGWLAGNARPGDNVVIFFAGHGSQMWDESGDEDDGLDETLAPADVLPTSTEFDISDDTFNEWLGSLPTDNVIVILDNCNSGTGTRDVTPFSRSRLLGRDIADIEKPETVSRRALPGQNDETGFDPGATRVLEFAAAQPDQAAVDAFFPGEEGSEPFHGGAFTTYLVRQLWRAPADATYEEVFRDAYEALKRNRFQQDPVMSEDVPLKSSPLFFIEGGGNGIADASVAVRSSTGSTVELGGGQALGITTGSVFETESGARMVVSAVTQRTSTANVISGSVSEGDRARLTAFRYARTALRVNVSGIDSESVEAIRSALEGSTGVQILENEMEFSHLIIRRRGDGLRIIGADGFVRHEGFELGAAGAQALAGMLKAEAAAKSLADMENPAQTFGVDIELEGGRSSFGIGEKVSFHATSDRDGYLTLVDLGTDGTVVMLFPNQHQPAVLIEAGQTISFPTEEMGFDLQIFPPAGRGMVRAFVTPEPLDVPMNSEYPEGDESFAQAIADAVKATAGMIEGAVRLDTWATASLVYDIHN